MMLTKLEAMCVIGIVVAAFSYLQWSDYQAAAAAEKIRLAKVKYYLEKTREVNWMIGPIGESK